MNTEEFTPIPPSQLGTALEALLKRTNRPVLLHFHAGDLDSPDEWELHAPKTLLRWLKVTYESRCAMLLVDVEQDEAPIDDYVQYGVPVFVVCKASDRAGIMGRLLAWQPLTDVDRVPPDQMKKSQSMLNWLDRMLPPLPPTT